MERHLTRHSANREVAGDDEVVCPEHLDLISGEGDGRVVFHVEKIGGFEMAVAVFVATPQLARIHLHGNRRTRGIVRVVLQSFVSSWMLPRTSVTIMYRATNSAAVGPGSKVYFAMGFDPSGEDGRTESIVSDRRRRGNPSPDSGSDLEDAAHLAGESLAVFSARRWP